MSRAVDVRIQGGALVMARWLVARVDERTIAPKAARDAFRKALERWATSKDDASRRAAAGEALAALGLMTGKSRKLAKAALPSAGDAPADVLSLATALGGGSSNDRFRS